jgi:hypothetical protein
MYRPVISLDGLTGQRHCGPVWPGKRAYALLRPVPEARIDGGFWHARRRVNAEVSIPNGGSRLETAGNLGNLRLAARLADGTYTGDLPFLDSDVHKWLEAVAWLLAGDEPGAGPGAVPGARFGARPGRLGLDRLAAWRDDVIELLAAAQRDDGYLQSYFQVARPAVPYTDLAWGHELYCAGHLIQAAVAHARGTGRGDLLSIACKFADHIDAMLGPGRTAGVDGHPGVETALVELYRLTGETAISGWPAISSAGAGTGCWATAGSAGPTGRTTLPCGKPGRWPGTPSVSFTCSPGPPTYTPRPGTIRSSPPWSGCGRT